MFILLIVAVWLASLALFVGLRAKAAKSRLSRREATHVPSGRAGVDRAYRRGTVPLGS